MISYSELRLEMKGQYVSYQLLLSTSEWYNKRLAIIKRDNHQCQTCGKEETWAEYDEQRNETWYFWPYTKTGDWVIGPKVKLSTGG